MAEDDESSQRWICVLGDGDQEIRIALGDPVSGGTTVERQLYIPGWLLESVGFEGIGEELLIRFERSESLPRAQNLKFHRIGDVPEGFDIRELLEHPLSELGVIRQGQMIPVPVLEGTLLQLESCGTDGYVFLDGAEVGLEIEGDLPAAPPTPSPIERVPIPMPDEPWDLLPSSLIAPVAPAPSTLPRGREQRPAGTLSAFVPFSGTGYRLC